jgi:hypothetical protein
VRTVSRSNLTERKNSVLKIHQENLKMVERINRIGVGQSLLRGEEIMMFDTPPEESSENDMRLPDNIL